MANPLITATPTNPAPGATVTATVVYSPRQAVLQATDQDGLVGTVTITGGRCALTIPGKTVTKVSDDGTTAVFTFTW
jgi:hypothetical protein